MAISRLGSLNSVQKTLIPVCILLTAVLFWSLLNLLVPDSGTSKNANNTNKTGNTTLQPIKQTQDGLASLNLLNSATNSATSENANSAKSARNITNTKEPTGQTQNESTGTGSFAPKPTKTKLTDLTAAENLVYTSDNRLFVTGNSGIFEIVARSASDVSIIDHTPKQRNCDFGGIVELSSVLYVNCSTLGSSYIYAAALTATPSFKRIYTFKSAILPNGLTADNSGNLYVASSFLGQILRLTPSVANPLTFASTGVWLNGAGPAADGIKFYAGSIYWTDGQFVNRVVVKADGTPGRLTRVLTSPAPTILDDLTIDNGGMLVTDHVYGVIRKYDLNGHSTGTIASFSGPSSVAWARAPFPAGSLIVTERAGNKVTLVTP